MLCFIARHFMIMDNQNNQVNTFINNQNFFHSVRNSANQDRMYFFNLEDFETNNLTYLLGNDDTTEEIAQVKLSL